MAIALLPGIACVAVRERTGAGDDASGSGGTWTGGIGATGGSHVRPPAVDAAVDAAADRADRPPTDGATVCTDAGNCDVGCGNGKIDPGFGEACDDGNSKSGDGCASDCKTVETGFICQRPGMPCVSSVNCGDRKLGGMETCDDGNTIAGDGCSSMCQREKGWDCLQAGTPCTPHCGDAIILRQEQCDPPNVGGGCSAACKVEPGFICDPPAMPANPAQPATCRETVCGDGKKEGAEACDDTNLVDGDGCSGACALEPDCSSGTCASKCGDAIKLPPEGCDDGNTTAGDGCSNDCKIETGSMCTDSAAVQPAQLNLSVTYRDFIAFPLAGATAHPDFEVFTGMGITPSLVKNTLDATGKPTVDGRCMQAGVTAMCPYDRQLSSAANFNHWYHDTPSVNLPVRATLPLTRGANGSYVYDSGRNGFYPIDKKGWTAPPARENTAVADPIINDGLPHNFGFTTEIHYFFQYRGGERLSFSGDDDVWIFINRRLALDLGGLHTSTAETLNVDERAAALGLTVGGLYEIALFHAERHSAGSNFKLTLTGFAPLSSVCAPSCGDGIVVSPEQCDLGRGMNVGGYNGCTADCRRGPFCGDAMVQSPNEQCDDGTNLTIYATPGTMGCAPGCLRPASCGDANVDGVFGEQCDLGAARNTGEFNGCTGLCLLGPRCGDGILQKDAGEQCDDGNTVGGDGCSFNCRDEIVE